MRRSTIFWLLVTFLAFCSLFALISHVALLRIDHTVKNGQWVQFLLTHGNVRLVWVESIGPRTDVQEHVFREYVKFWRICPTAESMKWKVTEVLGDERRPIVRDWRLDLAVWSPLVGCFLLIVVIVQRRVFARSVLELLRPRNMTDVCHPWRRWTRKLAWTTYFLFALWVLTIVNRGQLPSPNKEVSWDVRGRTLMNHLSGWTLIAEDEEDKREFWALDFNKERLSVGYYKTIPAMGAIEPVDVRFAGTRFVRENDRHWRQMLMNTRGLEESLERRANRGSSFFGFMSDWDSSGSLEYVGVNKVEVEPWVLLLLVFVWPIVAYLRGPLRRAWWRQKGHCGVCGYNLCGNVNGVCTECGTSVSLNAMDRPVLDVKVPINLNEVSI